LKERKRLWLSLTFILSLSLIVITVIIYFTVAANEKYRDQRYSLYYLSRTDIPQITSESRYLFPDSPDDLPKLLITTWLNGPEEERLITPFPEDVRLMSISISDSSLVVVLSEQYNSLDPYMRNLADCCLYRTVSAIPEINEVILRVSGSQQSIPTVLTADRFITDDHFFETSRREFTLYYPAADQTGLQTLRYPFTIYPDQSPIEIVLDLLEHKIFPLHSNVRLPNPLVNNTAVDDGIVYIDLSADFLIAPTNPDSESYEDFVENRISYLQAIVLSLSTLDDVDSVMFTFDKTVMGQYGRIDLSQPLMISHFQN